MNGRGDFSMSALARQQGAQSQTGDRTRPQPRQTPRQSRGEKRLLTPIHEDSLLRGSAQENGLAGVHPTERGHFKDYRTNTVSPKCT